MQKNTQEVYSPPSPKGGACMSAEDLEEKKKLIDKEIKRLKRQYKEIDDKTKQVIAGLIERAAFMRVSLDELEEDINIYGFTEWFSQSENQEPYLRKRPQADVYNSMNTAYQKIIKQLTDLLPKNNKKPEETDDFNAFVCGRAQC